MMNPMMMQGGGIGGGGGGGLQLVVMEDGHLQTKSLYSVFVYLKGMGYFSDPAFAGPSPAGGGPQGGLHGSQVHGPGSTSSRAGNNNNNMLGETEHQKQERRRMKVKINKAIVAYNDVKDKKRQMEQTMKLQQDRIRYLEEQCRKQGIVDSYNMEGG